MPLSISKPTLLIDSEKTRHNIDYMVKKAVANRVNFRPHFKTHQSAEIGEWFRKAGVSAITVSSVDMAVYFAEHGWDDILIAFPVNVRQPKSLNQLAHEINLHLLVESVGTAVSLNNLLGADVNVWLKVDAGYGRTGLKWNDDQTLLDVAHTVVEAPRLNLMGVLTHSGQTYAASSTDEITAIYEETAVRLNHVRKLLKAEAPDLLVSIGDTPGCSVVEDFGQVDEIRPGNFVFYDLTQRELGACLPDNISVGVACPIVAKHDAEQRLILYGGAVHLSKDSMLVDGERIYGRIARWRKERWGSMQYGSKLINISQEHGIVKVDRTLYENLHVGDIVVVLPVHSCLTADLYGHYTTLDGEPISKMRTNA